MTYENVYQMLADVGVPVVYYSWPDGHAPEPPYICYYYPGDNDFHADNNNYVKVRELTVELYTNHKDIALEEAVEAVLPGYTKNESYIDTERMFLVSYETEVLING